MKKILLVFVAAFLLMSFSGCEEATSFHVAATTAPVYEFTSRICSGTEIRVGRIITENVSCLHDYTLQTNQMRMIENAQLTIISGADLEAFLTDILSTTDAMIDASESIALLSNESEHSHATECHDHHHEHDPHIWLSPANARQMATNICAGLVRAYPQYAEQFNTNLTTLLNDFSALEDYADTQLATLSTRKLITFHDGFSYLADAYNLEILHAIEEESGSEASAAELIEICSIIQSHKLPAIFTEQNGSTSAAEIIASETGVKIYTLDMGLSGNGYFNTMYHNIDTLKEALG